MPSQSSAPSESSEPSQSSVPSESPSSSSAPTKAALQAFTARCESTSGLLGSNSYVDCVGGFVRGTTTDETCADACIVHGVSKCCTGDQACGSTLYPSQDGTLLGGFTGNGKQLCHSLY